VRRGAGVAARGQAAGPATRVRVAVWLVPVRSTHVTRTWSPGFRSASVADSASALSTVVPPTAVMVSPACRPASAAGEPSTTPEIVAAPAASCASCTPRKAGVPCWIVALSSPDWIRSAIETAFSIGIANPTVAAVWPDDAAVSMPTTLPSLA